MDSQRSSITIRPMMAEDVPAVVELQRRVFPAALAWTAEELTKHLSVFPEGQLVAVDESGKVVGSASSLIIDWDDYAESAKWSSITGFGTFSTPNPLGKTLYGADMCVDPFARRHHVGSHFYEARKQIIKQRGLKRLPTGGRIPGYTEVAQSMSPQEYVAEVVRGRRKDPTLSFQLTNAFIVLDVIPEYLEDPDSRGYATLLEWLNPEYTVTMSLEESEEAAAMEMIPEEASHERAVPSRIRIAAFQYLLRPIICFRDFSTQVEFFVRSAVNIAASLQCFLSTSPCNCSAVFTNRRLRGRSAGSRNLPLNTKHVQAARQGSGLYIIAGTHPVIQQGELSNAAHLFTPNGRIFRQKKVHLTQTEKGPYQMSTGHGFYVYHTDYGRIAILVCYDVEFPEAARILAEAGAQIVFVPSCTDKRQGFCRVRYCAQARASENQIYIAMTGTVGNLPEAGNAHTLRSGRHPHSISLFFRQRWNRSRRYSESGTDGHCGPRPEPPGRAAREWDGAASA